MTRDWIRIRCKNCGIFLCRVCVKEYRRGHAVLQFEVNCQKCKSVNIIDLNVDPPVNAQEDIEISYDDEKKGLA